MGITMSVQEFLFTLKSEFCIVIEGLHHHIITEYHRGLLVNYRHLYILLNENL